MSDPLEVTKGDITEPLDVDLHEDRTQEMTRPNFSRLRTDWEGEDKQNIEVALGTAQGRLMQEYSGLYAIMLDLYDIIREPEADSNGEIRKDIFGNTVHCKGADGRYIEDWRRLSQWDKEQFILRITSGMFAWKSKAEDLRFQAMKSKADYEYEFAEAYTRATLKTDSQRENHARQKANELRQFGIWETYYSRKVDALIDSALLFCQRLKDLLGA